MNKLIATLLAFLLLVRLAFSAEQTRALNPFMENLLTYAESIRALADDH
jgi:hypothetical protein